jgi:hypothetical protein
MLKIVKISLLIISASLLFSAAAQADVSDALQSLCAIDKTDEKGELRKKVKMVQSDYALKLQNYSGGTSCSAESLIRTVVINHAIETGTLLVKKLPKSDLNAAAKENESVYAWAMAKGMTESAIVLALNERI